jgi:hypothetical protein
MTRPSATVAYVSGRSKNAVKMWRFTDLRRATTFLGNPIYLRPAVAANVD